MSEDKKLYVYCNADIIIESSVYEFQTIVISEHALWGKVHEIRNIIPMKTKCKIKIDLTRYDLVILDGVVENEEEFVKVVVKPTKEWEDFVNLNSRKDSFVRG